MLVEIYANPRLKMAAAIQYGDIIRYKADCKDHYDIGIYVTCNTAKQGTITEIHLLTIPLQIPKRIYDTEKIENVSFEVIGSVIEWH